MSASVEGKFEELRVVVEKFEKSYDFTSFSQLGGEFVGALTKQFLNRIDRGEWSKASADSIFSDLKNLLEFIQNKTDSASSFRHTLRHNYKQAKRGDWQELLRLWRSEVAERSGISARTKDNKISRIRPFIAAVANAGVIPQVGDVLLGFEFDSSPKRSLAQMTNGAMTEAELSIRLKKLNKEVGEHEIPGAIDYFNALASEAEIEPAGDLGIPEQVLVLLDNRLDELRRCAEVDLIEEFKKITHGRQLVKGSDLSAVVLAEKVDACESPKQLQGLFPQGQKGFARLLAYYSSKFRGVRPTYYEKDGDGRPVGAWLNMAESVHGGARAVSAHLYASRRLLAAASIIVLHHTAMNVESCRTLRRDCLGDPKDGLRKLSWLKRRARGYENQYELMPIKDGVHKLSVTDVIEKVLSATEVLVKNAEDGNKHICYLFLSADGTTHNSYLGERVRLSANNTFLNNFKKLLRDHQGLSGLADSMTQDAIRPSLLLREALRTRSIVAVKALGKHVGTKTAFKYVHRLPTQISGNASIQLFMQSLQVLATQGIEGICEKAGISVEKYDALRAELFDTGLGVYCSDPMAGVQKDEGYGEGSMCGAIDKCLSCPNVTHYVFATPDNIGHLLMWRTHLLSERERMLNERPERWIKAWEPWLAFVEIALEKLKAGQFKKAFDGAEALVNKAEVVFPELW